MAMVVGKTGSLSVASVKNMSSVNDQPWDSILNWNYWLPLKINMFGWRATMSSCQLSMG